MSERERLPLPRSGPLGLIQYAGVDMHSYSDAENAALRAELANLKAADIHSCHDNCTRAGCVNARLRAQVDELTAERDAAMLDAQNYRSLQGKP